MRGRALPGLLWLRDRAVCSPQAFLRGRPQVGRAGGRVGGRARGTVDRQGAWTGSFPRPAEHEDALSIEGMAYVPGNEQVFWRLDATEDAQRRRRRLKRNYKGSLHPEAVLHADLEPGPCRACPARLRRPRF